MYTRSTALYDKLYHFKDYRKHSETLMAALRAAHPSASTLLEVACGTGRFLEHLQSCYVVEGLDINPEMVAIAQRRLPGIPLHIESMIDFDLGRTFDIVTCLFSSIAYVKTVENFFTTVRTLARHVAPGGILVIEPFFTPDNYWVDRITMNIADEPELKISWMYVSEKVGREARLNIHYLVGSPSGIEHFTELHELGLFTRHEYVEAFAGVGMDVVYDPEGPARRGLHIGCFKRPADVR